MMAIKRLIEQKPTLCEDISYNAEPPPLLAISHGLLHTFALEA